MVGIFQMCHIRKPLRSRRYRPYPDTELNTHDPVITYDNQGREILVSALREWMASRGKRDVVAVAFAGKVKTTVQMIAIIILLASDPAGPQIYWQLGYLGIYLAAVLSLYSMIIYFRGAWEYLTGEEQGTGEG